MLILFDIDGTLITSRSQSPDGGSRDGVGVAAWLDAGRNLFGEAFTLEGVEIAGRLDSLIWRDAARRCGLIESDEEQSRFRAEYGRMLRQRLANGATVRALPGVRELIDGLAAVEGVTLGLLTGNYPETGRMKLEAAGLDPDAFAVAAWGCDGASRRDLPPVAVEAHEAIAGRRIAFEQVVIIGDTPHDIDCARAHGCRSIGVATGSFSVESLRAVGADLAVEDLAATERLMHWLLQSRLTVPE
jgi:phosphoglycolate phosphatase